jgi:AcrR family transcriptional regulator
MTQAFEREQELEQYGRALPRGGRQLPAGRHRFSAEFVATAQRNRLIDAMAHAVARKGYEDTAVADVIDLAGVSRKTFYEHFSDKEACFLACYDTVFAALLGRANDAYESRRRWPERISAGLDALLRELASEPAYARAAIVEVLAAGPAAIERRDASLRAFQQYFDASRPEVPDHGAPPIVAEATIGGIYEIIYRRIVTDGAAVLPALHPEVAYLALAPFIGARAALRASGLDGRHGAASAGA